MAPGIWNTALSTLLLSTLALEARAANYAVVVGHPDFASTAGEMQRQLEGRDWDVTAVTSPATRISPDAVTQQIIDRLRKAGRGDQVLLHLDTHGARAGAGQKSHSVELPGGGQLDLDLLRAEIRDAQDRGVKCAINDLSCFSGLSQGLAETGACVVSLSSRDYFGFATKPSGKASAGTVPPEFVSQFVNLPRGKSISLEDQYNLAREGDAGSFNFPQISSIPYEAGFWNDFFSKTDPTSTLRGQSQLVAVSGRAPPDAEVLRFSGILGQPPQECSTSMADSLARHLSSLGGDVFAAGDSLLSPLSLPESRPEVERIVTLMRGYERELKKMDELTVQMNSQLSTLALGGGARRPATEDVKYRDPNRLQAKVADFRRADPILQELSTQYDAAAITLKRKASEIMRAERDLYAIHQRAAPRRGGTQNPCSTFML